MFGLAALCLIHKSVDLSKPNSACVHCEGGGKGLKSGLVGYLKIKQQKHYIIIQVVLFIQLATSQVRPAIAR